MLVEWDNTYSVGIELLDGHHRKLLELLNKSYLLILNDTAQPDDLSQLLDELIEYAKYHFSAEEELMRHHGYSRIDAHLIEHFSFLNKVLSYKKEVMDGKKYLSVEIFDFIKNWLLDHIMVIDSEMSKAVRSQTE